MTTPAGDGKTLHRARNLFDGIDLASNTMKVCLGVRFGLYRHRAGTSVLEGKAEVTARMSAVGGRADLDRNARNFAC